MKEDLDKVKNDNHYIETIVDVFIKMPNIQKYDFFARITQVFVQYSDFEDSTKNKVHKLANDLVKAMDREIKKINEAKHCTESIAGKKTGKRKLSHLVRKSLEG